MQPDRFEAANALAPLKAFQRRTVDYVFDRLYESKDPVHQFLVADEVGLGKTMVARGLIARTIEHLWDSTPRIDIVYICSNQAIAAQNLNRLNVLGRKDLALPTRMTLIPLRLRGSENTLDKNKVNFISLTPGTTFDLRSSTGVVQERAFLRRLLEDMVPPRGLHNLLQVNVLPDRWNCEVDCLNLEGVDRRIVQRFRREVRSDRKLFRELHELCERFPRRRKYYPPELTEPRNRLVAQLRGKLSKACVEALEPDLIILDEFQRFRDLLHGETDAALLARELFTYCEKGGRAARTLLLSATPYRMLTLAGDAEEEGDHYEDFLSTLRFLFGEEKGEEVAESLAGEMRAFRGFLHDLPRSHAAACGARQKVETCLKQVIARTERVSSTEQRDSMMCEPPVEVTLSGADLAEARAVAQLARVLGAPEIVEYWKSCPYLLNFMRSYDLNYRLREQAVKPTAGLLSALASVGPLMLSHDALTHYAEIDPGNGRMRALMDDTFREGLDQHLWMPPALAYYGEPKIGPPMTKSLVFSSWQMVPDAIAALLSYEAERRMGVSKTRRTYFEPNRLQPLNFRHNQERLAGLRALLLIYPSPTLAVCGDPLSIFVESSEVLSEIQIRCQLRVRIKALLEKHFVGTEAGEPGASDEWAVPAALDTLAGYRMGDWLEDPAGFSTLAEDAFNEHVKQLRITADSIRLQDTPDALCDLLVDVALGGPGVCALRALHRIAPDLGWDDRDLLNAAARVAWGFRTLFNQPDAIALLRSGSEERYWHRVLTFSAEHNLQAVLDEYAHYLVEAEGLVAAPAVERVAGVAQAMAKALSIRPSQIEVEDVSLEDGKISFGSFQMRGRFAMRLSDHKDEDGAVARIGTVRDAFNSPFRPFVLATTSVGQEGLDFHPYCYRLYHWNLPGNPVDMEQREGRIHRFKGHAVRLNLAYGQGSALRGSARPVDDPWSTMFAKARAEATVLTDLVPYWIYEGPVKVERRVPMMPFSREATRLAWLKRSLTVYRLAFGQPRQDDLLEYLQGRASEMGREELEALQINLEPA